MGEQPDVSAEDKELMLCRWHAELLDLRATAEDYRSYVPRAHPKHRSLTRRITTLEWIIRLLA